LTITGVFYNVSFEASRYIDIFVSFENNKTLLMAFVFIIFICNFNDVLVV